MAYTIVGMFPTNEDAERASNKLDDAGFAKEDYTLSKFNTTGDNRNYEDDYDEEERTSGFWNWLFGDDEVERKKYSYAGTRSNLVTVYTNEMDRAEKARDIMNDHGAIDVNEVSGRSGNAPLATETANSSSTSERAKIINKAKNELYFTNDDRSYTFRGKGMSDDMDSLGNRDDTF